VGGDVPGGGIILDIGSGAMKTAKTNEVKP